MIVKVRQSKRAIWQKYFHVRGSKVRIKEEKTSVNLCKPTFEDKSEQVTNPPTNNLYHQFKI